MNKRRLPLIAAGAALLAGCGCAGSMQPASQRPLPSTKGEARMELAELDRQISERRAALGLGPRLALAELAPPGGPQRATKSTAGGEAPAAPAAPREEAIQPAPAAKPSPPAAHESSDAVYATAVGSSEEDDEQERRLARCQQNKSCRFTKAICHAAERICRLARFLSESDAQKRCLRAQRDCSDARKATAGTCSDC
jgi:hypothetical protein